ncbi:MAG: hypothetical protein IKM83_07225 [Paludibacteraceae bacterium]|nr:hypothetical protein [Paludibacteraceae bacterium]
MKKILSLLAITAVVLGMASCKNENTTDNTINNEPEAPVTRFQITVDEITATSAHIVVTPPDEQLYYVAFPFNIATYNWYKAHEEGVKEALKIFEPGQGTNDYTWNLYPNTKYVLCVGEMNKETSSIVGDVESVQFQTKSMEAKLPEFVDEGQEYLPMTGSCGFMADNLVGFDGEYLLPDGDGEKLVLNFYVASDKLTGHFTTDDLFSFIFVTSYLTVEDSEGKSLEGYAVCGADLTGKFNDATEKYEYKGTVDIYTEDDGLLRLPIFLQCTENKSEN